MKMLGGTGLRTVTEREIGNNADNAMTTLRKARIGALDFLPERCGAGSVKPSARIAVSLMIALLSRDLSLRWQFVLGESREKSRPASSGKR